MIPPIPKQLLIHSAELITEFAPDKWGKATERDTVGLEHVRIEPSAKHVINGNGETVQLAAVLFFDCRNSSPADVKFALKDDTVKSAFFKYAAIDPVFIALAEERFCGTAREENAA